MAASDREPLVKLRGIVKSFGAAPVLKGVDLDLWPGETHLIAGENGAGKSTLIKILAGSLRADKGQILGSDDVAVIYQELSLIPSMTVADNLLLGRLPKKAGFVDLKATSHIAREMLARVGLDIAPERLVGDFPIGIQQRIEIAKAIGREAKVIVMDEPTSALTSVEVEHLFSLIHEIKSKGTGVVYITHKMEEIERIADRISVLRDGELVACRPANDLPRAELIRLMVGREVNDQYPVRTPSLGAERLKISEFEVKSGEILGLAGLQGSGASELLRSIFEGTYAGTVEIDGRQENWKSPRSAAAKGVSLLTNDRKATGLVLSMSVTANTVMAGKARPWRRPKLEAEEAMNLGRSMSLRAASTEMDVGELSGGNQQKVALAKWLRTRPRVLLLDEPTRGVDVGAKHEIYELMQDWSNQGMAIVLISTEMPELLALSDRIAVMRRGEVACILDKSEATPERVLEAAM